jgi:hypothetical protein
MWFVPSAMALQRVAITHVSKLSDHTFAGADAGAGADAVGL